jgi:hypothetical protein
VKELIYKKGRGFLDKEPFPLTSNDLIEKVLFSNILKDYMEYNKLSTAGINMELESPGSYCICKLKWQHLDLDYQLHVYIHHCGNIIFVDPQ